MLHISPLKLNLLAREIRGCPVDDALMRLTASPRRAAAMVRNVLDSAIANAQEVHGVDVDNLVVREAWVGKNFIGRRMRARARGRPGPYRRPYSEITIVLVERGPEEAS